MKTITVLKLGTFNTDTATGLKGMITHWQYGLDGFVRYLLQPKALNPETGLPVDKINLEKERFKDQSQIENIEVPVEILGSQVTDNASGLTGTAIAFVRHNTGCFHVVIQPAGVIKKTNQCIDRTDVALTQCSGPKIKVMTAAQTKTEETKRPSPGPAKFRNW